jgi:hypothetical protein
MARCRFFVRRRADRQLDRSGDEMTRYTITLWGVGFGEFPSALDAMAWARGAFGLGLPWKWECVAARAALGLTDD